MGVGKQDLREGQVEIGLKLEIAQFPQGLRGNFSSLSLKHTGALYATFMSRNTPSSLKLEHKLSKTMFSNKFSSIPSMLHLFPVKMFCKFLNFIIPLIQK